MTRNVSVLAVTAILALLSLTQLASSQGTAGDKDEIEKLKAQLKSLQSELDKARKDTAEQQELVNQLKKIADEAFQQLKLANATAEEAAKRRSAAKIAHTKAEAARWEAEKQRRYAEEDAQQAKMEHYKALAILLDVSAAFYEKSLVTQPKDENVRWMLAQTLVETAKLQYEVNDLKQYDVNALKLAVARCTKGIAAYRVLVLAEPAAAKYQAGLAGSLHMLGLIWMKIDDAGKSLPPFYEAIEIREKLLRDAPNDKGYRADLVASYVTLFDLHQGIGEYKEAAALALRAKHVVELK